MFSQILSYYGAAENYLLVSHFSDVAFRLVNQLRKNVFIFWLTFR